MTERTQLGMSQFTMIAPSYSIEGEKEAKPSIDVKKVIEKVTTERAGLEWIYRDSVVDAEMTREKPTKSSFLFAQVTP